jgi:hypothetical protein
MSDEKYGNRRWLGGDVEDLDSVSWWLNAGNKWGLSGGVSVRDYRDTCELIDFYDAQSPEGYESEMSKLNVLIEELTEFRTQWQAAWLEWYEKYGGEKEAKAVLDAIAEL